MNRDLWKSRTFEKKSPTQYPCPRCNVGVLHPKYIKAEITVNGNYLLEQNHHYGIDNVFCGILKCSNSICAEVVSFGGNRIDDYEDYEEIPNGDPIPVHLTIYSPKYFHPNLRLFHLHRSIPRHIQTQIDSSFAHYFNDLSACANGIRTSIEHIMDDIKAPKYILNKKRKRAYFSTLHSRIENFKNKNKTISTLLLAIKFIGNEGSHPGKIETEDIMDAYEILEEVLDIAYIKNRYKIVQIAEEINRNKKTRSKK